MAATRDPYEVLGISRDASEDELRSAYRRLVQASHPDHNQGSPESARRFETIQEAYAQVRSLRERAGGEQTPPTATADPHLDAELADLERQVRQAHAAREQARRAAAKAAATEPKRPSDEELGYIRTDDSFAKILGDAEAELTQRLAGAQDRPAGRRVSRLIDDLAAKLRGEDRSGS